MSLRDIPGLEGLAPLRASSPAPLQAHWSLRLLRTLLLWSLFACWLRLIWWLLDNLGQHAAPYLAEAWTWLMS